MRRILQVTLSTLVLALMLVSWPSSAAFAAGDSGCPAQGCGVGDQNGKPGTRPPLVVPPQDVAYCDPTKYPAHPVFHQVLLNEFLTADDRSISSANFGMPGALLLPIVVPNIAVAQKVSQWCGAAAPTTNMVANHQEFWVPLSTPDSVALQAGLLAKVQGRLTAPNVTWLDIDKDHDWLWVNVDHHAGITPPTPVSESATDGNPITGYATAWVTATPVSFTIELPDETGVKGTQLASCDLTKATSGEGCKIKFTHASSISKDGWFTGYAQVTWAVSSNSGKYNGVGPFTTSTVVRVQVAESMAVSKKR